jgi:hypothetical protein
MSLPVPLNTARAWMPASSAFYPFFGCGYAAPCISWFAKRHVAVEADQIGNPARDTPLVGNRT